MNRIITAVAALAAGITTAHAAITFTGPSSYVKALDNPLAAGSLLYSYLEPFEDGLFDTPGVLVSAGTLVNGPARTTDSVDAATAASGIPEPTSLALVAPLALLTMLLRRRRGQAR